MVSKTRKTEKDPEGPRRTKKDQVRLSKLRQTSRTAFASSSFSSWLLLPTLTLHIIPLYMLRVRKLETCCQLLSSNIKKTDSHLLISFIYYKKVANNREDLKECALCDPGTCCTRVAGVNHVNKNHDSVSRDANCSPALVQR